MTRVPEVLHKGQWIRPDAWEAFDDDVPLIWWHDDIQEIADPGQWRWVNELQIDLYRFGL